MKIPKRVRRYCPNCKSHQWHKVSEASRKQPSSLRRSIRREKARKRGHGSKGKYSSRPSGRKATKKHDLRYRCEECGSQQIVSKSRAKRFQIG